METADLYVLETKARRGQVELRVENTSSADDEWAIARGSAKPDTQIVLEVRRGTVFSDFLSTGFYPVVKSSLIKALVGEGITGWRAYPCSFVGYRVPTQDYFALGVVGRCKAITFGDKGRRSESVRIENGRRCVYASLLVDLEQWDHTDIFMEMNQITAHRCVTSRLRTLLAKLRITGVDLLPVEEYEMLTDVLTT